MMVWKGVETREEKRLEKGKPARKEMKGKNFYKEEEQQ